MGGWEGFGGGKGKGGGDGQRAVVISKHSSLSFGICIDLCTLSSCLDAVLDSRTSALIYSTKKEA